MAVINLKLSLSYLPSKKTIIKKKYTFVIFKILINVKKLSYC